MSHEPPEPRLEGAEHVATELTLEDRVEALERLVAKLWPLVQPTEPLPDYATMVNNPPDEPTT